MSERNNSLELYIVEKLKELNINARPTKASGAGNELLDILNTMFYVECRQNLTKENFIIQRKKDWLGSLQKLPVDSQKELLIVKENQYGEKIVAMEAESFFRMLHKLLEE